MLQSDAIGDGGGGHGARVQYDLSVEGDGGQEVGWHEVRSHMYCVCGVGGGGCGSES